MALIHFVTILIIISVITDAFGHPTKFDDDFSQIDYVPPALIPWEELGHYRIGDVIYTNHSRSPLLVNQGLIDSPSWPNGRIPYYIDPAHPKKKEIKIGIDHWNELLGDCVELTPMNRRDNKHYVHIVNSKKDSCSSYLGRRPDGPQQLSLYADGCTDIGTIVHEFGHAAGLIHEHQRADREIKVHKKNIKKDRWPDWDVDNKAKAFGPYNCYSIMHYKQVDDFSIDERPAFSFKPGHECDLDRVGTGDDFDEGDIKVLRSMYCG